MNLIMRGDRKLSLLKLLSVPIALQKSQSSLPLSNIPLTVQGGVFLEGEGWDIHKSMNGRAARIFGRHNSLL